MNYTGLIELYTPLVTFLCVTVAAIVAFYKNCLEVYKLRIEIKEMIKKQNSKIYKPTKEEIDTYSKKTSMFAQNEKPKLMSTSLPVIILILLMFFAGLFPVLNISVSEYIALFRTLFIVFSGFALVSYSITLYLKKKHTKLG